MGFIFICTYTVTFFWFSVNQVRKYVDNKEKAYKSVLHFIVVTWSSWSKVLYNQIFKAKGNFQPSDTEHITKQIIFYVGVKTVVLPWLCMLRHQIASLQPKKFELCFFPLDNSLEPCKTSLIKEGSRKTLIYQSKLSF